MPARLLSPTGAGQGYIPDGHRRNWDQSLTRVPHAPCLWVIHGPSPDDSQSGAFAAGVQEIIGAFLAVRNVYRKPGRLYARLCPSRRRVSACNHPRFRANPPYQPGAYQLGTRQDRHWTPPGTLNLPGRNARPVGTLPHPARSAHARLHDAGRRLHREHAEQVRCCVPKPSPPSYVPERAQNGLGHGIRVSRTVLSPQARGHVPSVPDRVRARFGTLGACPRPCSGMVWDKAIACPELCAI
ncbi:hypothetical protein Bbelb_242030 [Branchiostoma belcheri]|nr:hypothetical protein Bbelb_242030 [Branchiostoma belcheri]